MRSMLTTSLQLSTKAIKRYRSNSSGKRAGGAADAASMSYGDDVEAGAREGGNHAVDGAGTSEDEDEDEDEDEPEEIMHNVYQRNALDVRMITNLGLKIEKVYSQCNKYIFTLVHAPFHVLLESAERLGYYKRLNYDLVDQIKNGKFKQFLKGDLDKKYDGTFGHDTTDNVLHFVSKMLPRFAAKVMYTYINTSADNDSDIEEDVGRGTCGCKGKDDGDDDSDGAVDGGDSGGGSAYAAASRAEEEARQAPPTTTNKQTNNDPHFDSFKPRRRRGVGHAHASTTTNANPSADNSTAHAEGGSSRKSTPTQWNTAGYEFQSKFEVEFAECFQDFDSPEKFFKPAQRIELAWGVLKRAKQRSFEVQFLITQGVYLDAYSLHDGNTHKEDGGLCISTNKEDELDNDHYRSRAKLQRIWGNLRLFFKPQPFEAIRQYFGSKIAMYFLWLNVYTAFLWPPAIFGVLCMIYGIVYAYGFETDDVYEFCNVGADGLSPYVSPLTPDNETVLYNHTMCAACLTCVPNKMADMCSSYKLARVFDNEATILFGVFMAVWSVTFLDFWKRIRASHVLRWNYRGTATTGETVGHKRSQFVGKMFWFSQYVDNDEGTERNASFTAGRDATHYKVERNKRNGVLFTLLELAAKILRSKSRHDILTPTEIRAYAEQLRACNNVDTAAATATATVTPAAAAAPAPATMPTAPAVASVEAGAAAAAAAVSMAGETAGAAAAGAPPAGSAVHAGLFVDGSRGEGGGQVLRNACAYACILGKPLEISKIRAGRSKPGLKAQHLTGLQLATQISGGKLYGGELNSTSIKLLPGQGGGGGGGGGGAPVTFTGDTKTASRNQFISFRRESARER